MFKFLSTARTLWTSFILTVLMTAGFVVIMNIWSFMFIDEMYRPDEIKTYVDSLTPLQKSVHAWSTATLDVAYPFAYGGFFIGMAIRYFGRFGPWFAAPSIAVIPVDLVEGASQVLLLNGHDGMIALKAIVTPLKLGLYFAGLAIALAGAGVALFRLMRR